MRAHVFIDDDLFITLESVDDAVKYTAKTQHARKKTMSSFSTEKNRLTNAFSSEISSNIY